MVRQEAEPAATPTPQETTTTNTVDNALIRQQVARWALLNDCWYQHNYEYLNGSITMRGALKYALVTGWTS